MEKKYLFIIVFLAAISSIANASEYGLGVSVNSFESTIFLPINLNDEYRVEPYINYQSQESDFERKVEIYKTYYKYSQVEVGVGVFKLIPNQENVNTYFGVRVSYVDQKSDSENRSGSYSSIGTTDLTGYSIAPVIGLEYSITQYFVLGLEAEWRYKNIDGEGKEYIDNVEIYTEHKNESETRTGTNTRVVLRYFF